MDLHVKGRGTRITDRIRQAAEHKLSRLQRMEPRLTRVELAVVTERNPRQGGAHRVEAVAETPRKTFRAHANAHEVEAALDVLAERLERQIRDHHKRKRARLLAGAGRVKSARTQAAPAGDEDSREPELGRETT